MRTSPASSAEVDTWLAVLRHHGHLHHAAQSPDNTWTVRRSRHDRLWTLHHPVLAMDWIETVLRDVRGHETQERGTGIEGTRR